VTITSGPIRFCDGDIGWGYVGVDGKSGPFLISTAGVCFSTPDPTTGTEDCSDRYTAPATGGGCLATSAFTTSGISSFRLMLSEHDGSSTTSAIINGTGVNPLLFSQAAPPLLSQVWHTTIDTSGPPPRSERRPSSATTRCRR